jgi:transcriptional regulator with XRE-family HTH domain
MDDSNVPDAVAQRNAVFEFFTGQDYTTVSSTPASMLRFLYEGKTDRHPVDTKTAAARLGVTQRTVQRWVKGDSKPRPELLKKLTDRTRQSVTTKRGRAALVKKAKAGLPGDRRTLIVHGVQGLSADPQDMSYNRNGNSHIHLSDDEQQGLLDAWGDGGDKGALSYLEGIYDQPGRYEPGWRFHGVDGMRWR